MHTNRGAVGPVDNVCRDTDDGAYHCPLCDTPFTRRSNLRRHFQIHTKNTPPGGEICERPSAQKLQYDLLSSCPRKRKPGNNSNDGPNTRLISENLPVPASPGIWTTGAHHSHGTTGYASYLPGFDFPDSLYNNATEYSYPSSSSIEPPYEHVLPPMNSIPSLTGFSQCGSPSSSGSFGLSPDFLPNNHPRPSDFAPTQPNYNGQWWIPPNTYTEEIEYPTYTRRVEGIAMGNAMTRTQTGSTFMSLPFQVVMTDHLIYDYPIGQTITTEETF